MATFTVDPATLSELSCTLTGVHSHMQSMKSVTTGYEGLLGGRDLEGEVTSFCGTWHFGIGQLGDHMTKIIERLNHAQQGYSGSEQAIVKAASSKGHR